MVKLSVKFQQLEAMIVTEGYFNCQSTVKMSWVTSRGSSELLLLKMSILARWSPRVCFRRNSDTEREAQGLGKGRCVRQNRMYFRIFF